MWAFKSAFITNIRSHRSHLWVLVPCTNFLCILKSSATKNVLPHSSPKIIQKLVKILFVPKKIWTHKYDFLLLLREYWQYVSSSHKGKQTIRRTDHTDAFSDAREFFWRDFLLLLWYQTHDHTDDIGDLFVLHEHWPHVSANTAQNWMSWDKANIWNLLSFHESLLRAFPILLWRRMVCKMIIIINNF